MRILIISAQPPAPYSGGEIRLLNLIKPLSASYAEQGYSSPKSVGSPSSKHEFTVLAPVRDMDNPSVRYAIGSGSRFYRFIPVLAPPAPPRSHAYYLANGWWKALTDPKPQLARSFYSTQLKQALDRLLRSERFDIIQAQQFLTAQYVTTKITIPAVLDVDNLWSTLLPRQRALRQGERFTRRIQANLDGRKIRHYEQVILRRFNACLAITEQDEGYIRSLAPGAQTAVITNGVDTSFFQATGQQVETPGRLLFTGTLGWGPNVDAVVWFAREVFPIIQQKHPQVSFRIVGRDPTPEVRALAKIPGIDVTGFVEDIRPELASCQVFVVPLRAGAGTRLKILEALAMGKAVVSTSIGAEGLMAENGMHLLLSEDPGQFAASIIKLFDEPTLAARLGHNGRRLVESNYDWKAIAEKLNEVYHGLGI